jgi:hypothetical protein
MEVSKVSLAFSSFCLINLCLVLNYSTVESPASDPNQTQPNEGPSPPPASQSSAIRQYTDVCIMTLFVPLLASVFFF